MTSQTIKKRTENLKKKYFKSQHGWIILIKNAKNKSRLHMVILILF